MISDVFRKKSLERIKSPESLNDYIAVASPGVWLLLAAVVLLLVGMLCWGIFGKVETSVSIPAVVDGGVASFLPDENVSDTVRPGMPVRILDEEGIITSVDSVTGMTYAEIKVPDGIYTVEVITDTFRPASFLFD